MLAFVIETFSHDELHFRTSYAGEDILGENPLAVETQAISDILLFLGEQIHESFADRAGRKGRLAAVIAQTVAGVQDYAAFEDDIACGGDFVLHH